MNNRFNSNKADANVEGKRQTWNKISRIAAFFVSIAIWWVSINFSTQGFNLEVANMAWIGWVLGICVTVIEIVFNKPGINRNVTLWVIGLMAYVYGMYTNVIGIWAAQGSLPGIKAWIFPGILGSVLEWIPEVLFVWAILGVVTSEGDFLGNIIKMFSGGGDDNDRSVPPNLKAVAGKGGSFPSRQTSTPYRGNSPVKTLRPSVAQQPFGPAAPQKKVEFSPTSRPPVIHEDEEDVGDLSDYLNL
jgi:hypothetical protein